MRLYPLQNVMSWKHELHPTWFWKILPFYEDQLPLHRAPTSVRQIPRLLNRNTKGFGSGYLEPTSTWVHFWDSSRIGIERFHWGFGIGVGTDPLFYKILKPKSNLWLVPSCDFSQNQIGFLITIRFCFRFLSRDLLVNSQVCNIIFFHIREFENCNSTSVEYHFPFFLVRIEKTTSRLANVKYHFFSSLMWIKKSLVSSQVRNIISFLLMRESK
jgi:hypothetical protein